MAEEPPYHFSGFGKPTYTQVPDELFDELLSRLSESELKVLLYIIRRTFGFKKESDNISLRQMVDGIVTKDGRRLDHGAGISKTSVTRGVSGLVEKGVIVAVRNRSAENGDEPTTYQLKFTDDPVSKFVTPPSPNLEQAPVSNMDPQETVKQQTEDQESSKLRKVNPPFSAERGVLGSMLSDFSREFGDEAPLSSTVTRALVLFEGSELSFGEFTDLMYQARGITQERTASISKLRSGEDSFPRKNKTPYFFATLEQLVRDHNR